MNRRRFLATAGAGAAAAFGAGFWDRALSQTAQPGTSPYGPLRAPDANGLMLPEGFTSRIVATSLLPAGTNSFLWRTFPDGGGCVPTSDGGWLYLSNSETPPPLDLPFGQQVNDLVGTLATLLDVDLPGDGGATALAFGPDGTIGEAWSILDGSQSNCAGGLTPWGTWLSCEEWEIDQPSFDGGRVWECDPTGATPAVARHALGHFKHEMAACDADHEVVYLSEDQTDGLFYRYVAPPGTWGSGAAFEGGALQAMAVADDGTVTWIDVADFVDPAAPAGPIREAVVGATHFSGGEGVVYDQGRAYLTTKPPDDRVWVYDTEAGTMRVLYAAAEHADPVLSGVDNIAVSRAHDLYVAEDGGNLEVCMIGPDLVVSPVLRMTGAQHGFDSGTPLPLMSEVTGLAFSPDGNRLYFNSQRGMGIAGLPVGPGPGITYEVTGPFRGGTLAAGGGTTPTTTTPTTAPPTTSTTAAAAGRTGQLPATGTGPSIGLAGAAAAATAAGLLAARRRVTGS